jgi:cytochrome c oxidase assembly protein subunit 15
VYTFWFALKLLVPPGEKLYKPSSKRMVEIILILLAIQLIYGAFMAGLKAASVAPTWPTINGEYFPPAITKAKSFSFSSLINDSIVVQFIHRNLAYIIFIMVVFQTIKIAKEERGTVFKTAKWLPFFLVCLQVILGVVALLTSLKKISQRWGSFEWTALLHQAVAMLLLLSLAMVFYLLSAKETSKSSVGFDKPVI